MRMHPLQRGRCGSRHCASVLCVFLAFLFVLAAGYCTSAHAQHHMSELAEHESVVLEKAVKHFAGSGFNDAKHVAEDEVFDNKDAQVGDASDIRNSAASAKDDESFLSLEMADRPSTKSGSTSSASASSAGAATWSASSVPGDVSKTSMPGSTSAAASSDSFTAYSSSSTETRESADSEDSEATAASTDTSSTITRTTTSPTAELPTEEGGWSSAVVFLVFIAFVAALVMYGGRLCPSKCPLFGQNGGGPDHGTNLPMQQQHPLYARLHGSDGDRGMEPNYATTGAPAGGHKFGRLFQKLRDGDVSEGPHELFVEMEVKPSKTLRDSGVRIGDVMKDSLSQVVARNSAAVNECLGDSISSACPVTVQVPQSSKNSLKSLRKGKLAHTPALAAPSFAFGTVAASSDWNAHSLHDLSTAGMPSSHAGVATASQTTNAPRMESAWKW